MFTKLFLRAQAALEDEAGDVPGWVLITLMTAALVLVVWAVAQPVLQGLIDDALSGITFTRQ